MCGIIERATLVPEAGKLSGTALKVVFGFLDDASIQGR